MRLALFQYVIETVPEKNLQKISDQVDFLSDKGVDLLILPEVCLTGFGNRHCSEGFKEDSSYIQSFVQMSQKVSILGGFRIFDQGVNFNRALFFHKGKICNRYDKQILFRHWEEHKRFEPGNRKERFDHEGWNVAPLICYELRFPEVFRALMGTELFIVIANWPESRREHWLTLLRARAIENQAYVAGSNRLGDVGEECFVGDSVIFGPRGEPTLNLGANEGCEWADLDLSSLRAYRENFPVLKDAME